MFVVITLWGATNSQGKKSNYSPSLDKECRTARKYFHLTKKNYNKCKSGENLNHFNSQSKNNKWVMNEYTENYRKSITEKIKSRVLQILQNTGKFQIQM